MIAMNVMKHFLLIMMMVVGLSVSAFAQKGDKKPPRKAPPPVVNPAPSKPPPDTSKPKKPNSEFSLIWKREERPTA